MKKIEIKKFKTAPDLAKMIEEGHKVHAMANGKIQSYERHTPQPEDYSNLDDFMEVAENLSMSSITPDKKLMRC